MEELRSHCLSVGEEGRPLSAWDVRLSHRRGH